MSTSFTKESKPTTSFTKEVKFKSDAGFDISVFDSGKFDEKTPTNYTKETKP